MGNKKNVILRGYLGSPFGLAALRFEKKKKREKKKEKREQVFLDHFSFLFFFFFLLGFAVIITGKHCPHWNSGPEEEDRRATRKRKMMNGGREKEQNFSFFISFCFSSPITGKHHDFPGDLRGYQAAAGQEGG